VSVPQLIHEHQYNRQSVLCVCVCVCVCVNFGTTAFPGEHFVMLLFCFLSAKIVVMRNSIQAL
jgi:hypothetical protein